FFVASWTGVIKYHGPRPSVRSKQIFVANHTSMIDFIVLEQMTAFAVIMQKHPGWVGLLQSTILESLGCNKALLNQYYDVFKRSEVLIQDSCPSLGELLSTTCYCI
ncbi:hypothetical protein SOVF_102640, partial [Spinacia oleracea]